MIDNRFIYKVVVYHILRCTWIVSTSCKDQLIEKLIVGYNTDIVKMSRNALHFLIVVTSNQLDIPVGLNVSTDGAYIRLNENIKSWTYSRSNKHNGF